MYTSWWQGACADRFGYPTTLALDAGLGLACILLFPLMTVHKTRQSNVLETQAD
jgi:hypothetical protein